MLHHSVFFRFKDGTSQTEIDSFFFAANKLANIPGVQHFISLIQTSTKNNFTHGLAMQFIDEEDYAAYTIHPTHQQFINNSWVPYIADFLEIDYKIFNI